jgi:hypothetical protein
MDDQATPHTYQQAAEALGIEAEVVRARLRRGPLTNDRRPTVLLSLAEIAPIRSGIQTDRPEKCQRHRKLGAPRRSKIGARRRLCGVR